MHPPFPSLVFILYSYPIPLLFRGSQENITYQPMEMDYKTFLDLYLALEYKSTIEAMSYFWRVLDIDKCGRLTPSAIKYFYSDIYDSLRATGYEAPSVENVIIEIYDILGEHPRMMVLFCLPLFLLRILSFRLLT